jgi:hypothetical protein
MERREALIVTAMLSRIATGDATGIRAVNAAPGGHQDAKFASAIYATPGGDTTGPLHHYDNIAGQLKAADKGVPPSRMGGRYRIVRNEAKTAARSEAVHAVPVP